MLEVDDVIDGRYRINSRLGTGGMADVYDASDIITRKQVALKILKEDLSDDKTQTERMKNEFDMCSFMTCDNVVRVFAKGEADGRPYIVYEYMNGSTLSDKLKNRLHFSLKEGCLIMLQVCDGLSYIHRHDVIHRDIKPDNIYYTNVGTVKIGDFGISYDLKKKHGDKREAVGSVHYMAPELCRGFAPSVQSDIYALGITFFELITGCLPFDEGDAKDIMRSQIKKSLPSVHEYNPELPKTVDEVIEKACAKRPQDRYKDCEEFKKDIQNILDNKDNFIQKRNIFKRFFGLK